ncbi:Splicing factor 3B subunit 4 [Galdieria sulphuraria]|nr:Splicing factor 3B subunit 4 [Galdieria sulphuraria]
MKEFQKNYCGNSWFKVMVLNMVRVYAKPLRLQQASTDKRSMDIGANLFVGNLSQEVDEKLLYDTFSAFGAIIETPHIMRDPETGESKGYGFIKFDSFEASDAAIETMNGQFLGNNQVTVQYAFKKDTKERHGSQAERILAARARAVSANALLRPHSMFSLGPQAALAYSGLSYPAMMPTAYPPGVQTFNYGDKEQSVKQQ